MMIDGHKDRTVEECKLIWDEENRLLAVDENGFVSNYWYDANGERSVKTSGENEAIYVNSEFSGGNTGTARFLLYVSPYLVAGQGGKYTKHIYIGSQRIVSKLGDLASYGADPRRIPYAGNEADGLTINYKEKYAQQLQSIKDNYKTFDIPYTGMDNNDYVNGQGFCCNDGTPEAAQARAMARASIDGNFKPNEEYEKMQFYYHPDHLGSSSYITNLDGEVSQHIEYVPFGEVFIEERNNTWNTPYLFNAKELDEETGMYYYGARYYNPRLSLWMSTDPLQEKYPNISTYCYTANNPIKFIDPDGKEVVIVFDKENGTLAIIDLDHYKKGLPNKIVTAKDYVYGGIRDKNGNLTHNQILILDEVFSGGQAGLDDLTRDLQRDPAQLAIPNGYYDLTEYEKHSDWYKVDPIDQSRYDDHHQGYVNSDGKTRSGYRLHKGRLSHGCITVSTAKRNREEEWDVVSRILSNTSKTEVPKREGMQKYIKSCWHRQD